jgi:hypothetical protein
LLAYQNAAEATLNQHGFSLRAMRDSDLVIKRIRHDTVRLRLQRERLAGLTQPGFVRPPDPRVRPANWKPLRFFRTASLDSVSTVDAPLAARLRSPVAAGPRRAVTVSRQFAAPTVGLTGDAARVDMLRQALIMRTFGDSAPPTYADTAWTGWEERSGNDETGSVTRRGSGYLFSSSNIATMSLQLSLYAELLGVYQPISSLGITAGARRDGPDTTDITLSLGDYDLGPLIRMDMQASEEERQALAASMGISVVGGGETTTGFPFSYTRTFSMPFTGREISIWTPTEPLPLWVTLGWRGDTGVNWSLELDTVSVRLSGNLWASVTLFAELSVDLLVLEPYVRGDVVLADHTYNFGGYNIVRPDQVVQAGPFPVPTYSAARQLWVTSELEALKGSIQAGFKGYGSVEVLPWPGVQLFKGDVVRVEDAVRLR